MPWGVEADARRPSAYSKRQPLSPFFPAIEKRRHRVQSGDSVSDSQSVQGAKSPRPLFAASTGASFTASFGVLSLFGKNLTRSPQGVVQRRPSRSQRTDDSSCGQRQAKPKRPVRSEDDS